jgi:hypothetical protein
VALLPWSAGCPLHRLDAVYAGVREALTVTGPIAMRLDVSARWFAEAFWTDDRDDAALAPGVALDALLGSKSGLPGRAMTERFALLDPVPGRRSERAERYLEIYGVRSSVAHGGQSSRLDDYKAIRAIENDVSWAMRGLLALHSAFAPSTQTEFDEVFEGLHWGTAECHVSIVDHPNTGTERRGRLATASSGQSASSDCKTGRGTQGRELVVQDQVDRGHVARRSLRSEQPSEPVEVFPSCDADKFGEATDADVVHASRSCDGRLCVYAWQIVPRR